MCSLEQPDERPALPAISSNGTAGGRHIGAGNQVKAGGDVFADLEVVLGPAVAKRLKEAIEAEIDKRIAAALSPIGRAMSKAGLFF